MRGSEATKRGLAAGFVAAEVLFFMAEICAPLALAAGVIITVAAVWFALLMCAGATELESRRNTYSGRLPSAAFLRRFHPGAAGAFALALCAGLVPAGIFFDTRFLYMTIALIVSAKILKAVHRTVTPKV